MNKKCLCCDSQILNKNYCRVFTGRGKQEDEELFIRFKKIGITIKKSPSHDFVCRLCVNVLAKIEKVLPIYRRWESKFATNFSVNRSATKTSTPRKLTPLRKKRILSPSIKLTPGYSKRCKSKLSFQSSILESKENIDNISGIQEENTFQGLLDSLGNLGFHDIKKLVAYLFEQEKVSKEIRKALTKLVDNETKTIFSNSVLSSVDVSSLTEFDEKRIQNEMKKLAPWSSAVLEAISITTNHFSICLAYNILYKLRYPRKPSVICHLMDQLLIWGGAKKRLFKRFNHLHLTNSHQTAVLKNRELGKDYDLDVLKMKQQIEKNHLVRECLEQILLHLKEDCPCVPASDHFGRCRHFNQEILEYVKETAVHLNYDLMKLDDVMKDEIIEICAKDISYQIIGDNIDFFLHARHQSSSSRNQSIHWFNQVVVVNRVIFPSTPELYIERDLDILPGVETQRRLHAHFKTIIMRILSTYIEAFKPFRNLILWHINHRYQDEMSKKSEVIPLGILFKSENDTADMIDIMMHNNKYIPKKKVQVGDEEVDEIIRSISFGGDQLTENRAIHSQLAFRDGDTKLEGLLGPDPKFEDWHCKVCLYEVRDKIFRKETSTNEKGTSSNSIILLNASNAKAGPHDGYNAYKDFTDKETYANVIASTMVHLGMESCEDDPTPTELENADLATKMCWLEERVGEIIEKFIADKTDMNKIPKLVRFCCRYNGCKKIYKTPETRKQHEYKKHNLIIDDASYASSVKDDHIYNYSVCNLRLGLLQMAINDCIKEGDGESLIEYYKIVLLYFKKYGRTNYAHTLVKLLLRINSFEPHNAKTLTWNRFVNTSGKRGKNISLDLHLEHINRFTKNLLQNLGPNLNEKNASRVSESVKSMKLICENIDKMLNINDTTSEQKIKKDEDDVRKLATEFNRANIFKYLPPRQHHSFKGFPPSLLLLDYGDYFNWIDDKYEEFSSIYGDKVL